MQNNTVPDSLERLLKNVLDRIARSPCLTTSEFQAMMGRAEAIGDVAVYRIRTTIAAWLKHAPWEAAEQIWNAGDPWREAVALHSPYLTLECVQSEQSPVFAQAIRNKRLPVEIRMAALDAALSGTYLLDEEPEKIAESLFHADGLHVSPEQWQRILDLGMKSTDPSFPRARPALERLLLERHGSPLDAAGLERIADSAIAHYKSYDFTQMTRVMNHRLATSVVWEKLAIHGCRSSTVVWLRLATHNQASRDPLVTAQAAIHYRKSLAPTMFPMASSSLTAEEFWAGVRRHCEEYPRVVLDALSRAPLEVRAQAQVEDLEMLSASPLSDLRLAGILLSGDTNDPAPDPAPDPRPAPLRGRAVKDAL